MPGNAGRRRRRPSHTAGDKLGSRSDGGQHAGDARSGHIFRTLSPDAKHSAIFHLSIACASHHNNLFYGPYGTSYEIHALALPSGEVIERCWFWGPAKCCCATANCRLCFRAPGCAQDPSSIKALPSQPDSGRVVESREVSDRGGRQTAPDFTRSDIRTSLFDGECPRRKSIAGKSSLPAKAGAMRKAASFLRDFRPASGGGRFFWCARHGADRRDWRDSAGVLSVR